MGRRVKRGVPSLLGRHTGYIRRWLPAGSKLLLVVQSADGNIASGDIDDALIDFLVDEMIQREAPKHISGVWTAERRQAQAARLSRVRELRKTWSIEQRADQSERVRLKDSKKANREAAREAARQRMIKLNKDPAWIERIRSSSHFISSWCPDAHRATYKKLRQIIGAEKAKEEILKLVTEKQK